MNRSFELIRKDLLLIEKENINKEIVSLSEKELEIERVLSESTHEIIDDVELTDDDVTFLWESSTSATISTNLITRVNKTFEKYTSHKNLFTRENFSTPRLAVSFRKEDGVTNDESIKVSSAIQRVRDRLKKKEGE